MKKEIYEKDFSEEFERQRELAFQRKLTQQEIDIYRFLYQSTDEYTDELVNMPKVVSSEAKLHYEYLLHRGELFARRVGGTIRGVIDHENYASSIEMTLPFAEFSSYEDMEFLREISQEVATVLFQSTLEKKTRIVLTIDYFHIDVPEDQIRARMVAAYQKDMERIAILRTIAKLPKDVLDNFPILMKKLLQIVSQSGMSSEDTMSIFVQALDEREVEITDINGAIGIADEMLLGMQEKL